MIKLASGSVFDADLNIENNPNLVNDSKLLSNIR